MMFTKLLNVLLIVVVVSTLVILWRVLDQGGELQVRITALESERAQWNRLAARGEADAELLRKRIAALESERAQWSQRLQRMEASGAGIRPETSIRSQTDASFAEPPSKSELPPAVETMLDDAVTAGYIDAQGWQELRKVLASSSKEQNRRIWTRLAAEMRSGRLKLQIDR